MTHHLQHSLTKLFNTYSPLFTFSPCYSVEPKLNQNLSFFTILHIPFLTNVCRFDYLLELKNTSSRKENQEICQSNFLPHQQQESP